LWYDGHVLVLLSFHAKNKLKLYIKTIISCYFHEFTKQDRHVLAVVSSGGLADWPDTRLPSASHVPHLQKDAGDTGEGKMWRGPESAQESDVRLAAGKPCGTGREQLAAEFPDTAF
jgi:hypothetical protein